jgi:putative phage-type endonuclease
MITADRFLVRSTDREAWLEARRGGVSATTVATAATPSGFQEVAAERLNPVDIADNPYMAFGRESEAEIMRYAHHEHGILPSDWAIAAEGNPLHIATPDGLSPDHTLIAEAKTTGKDWGETPVRYEHIPIKYRRQVQWQLYVTGAQACLFLWQLRVPDGDWFRFGFWEPKFKWIERDPKMIEELVGVADRLLTFKED